MCGTYLAESLSGAYTFAAASSDQHFVFPRFLRSNIISRLAQTKPYNRGIHRCHGGGVIARWKVCHGFVFGVGGARAQLPERARARSTGKYSLLSPAILRKFLRNPLQSFAVVA
jgi:hypothetical protein